MIAEAFAVGKNMHSRVHACRLLFFVSIFLQLMLNRIRLPL